MRNPDVPLFTVSGYEARMLGLDDGGALQILLEKSSDYVELATGSPPGPSAAESLLRERPEAVDPSNKLVIGLFGNPGELAGVIDALRDYPCRDEWLLGLLLLDSSLRGRGLGQKVYSAFRQWAAGEGGRGISVGVLLQNERALRFWERVGFQEVERRQRGGFGGAGEVVIVMRAAAGSAAGSIALSSPTPRCS